MTRLGRLVSGGVRFWIRVYTWNLSPAVRDARREEIDADIWESEHDAQRGSDLAHATRMLARVLLGIPDDLGWRLELEAPLRNSTTVKVAAAAACAIALAAGWMIAPSFDTTAPPAPPSPGLVGSASAPEPPPPPPPPAPPGKRMRQVLSRYSTEMVAYRVDASEKPWLATYADADHRPNARDARFGEIVVVRTTVTPDGRPSNTRVVRSIPALDAAVLEAVHRWHFAPARMNGQPVKTEMQVVARFRPRN